LRRFLGLSSALGCVFFFVGFATTRYSRQRSPQDVAFRGHPDTEIGLDKTLLSSKSFKKQAIDLGLVAEDESNAYKKVTVLERPSLELERAPRHHKTKEYHLILEDDSVSSHDVEMALSEALTNGKTNTDEILLEVSNNVKHHMNFDQNAPSKDESIGK
jgi:hypothetical protein